MASKLAWGDEPVKQGGGTDFDTSNGTGDVINVGKASPTSQHAGATNPHQSGADSEVEADDREQKSRAGTPDGDDAGSPGCCSRCCAGCCGGIGLCFKAIGWLIAYLVGFVFIIALAGLHIAFRVFHAVFNLLAQLRRADLDMVKEFDYEDESDASGTEADEEEAALQAIENHERFQAEMSMTGGGAASGHHQGRMVASTTSGGGSRAAYRADNSNGSVNGLHQAASRSSTDGGGGKQVLPSSSSSSVYVPPPKRTREEIRDARKDRRKNRADDRRRVTAMLAGEKDPGAADGSGRPVKPPMFASCRCVTQVFIAFIGMLMVSIAFLFYSLSQVTLLGLVALLSILFPRTTIGGMQMAKEFQERNDIICRRPWVPPPPPPPQDENDA